MRYEVRHRTTYEYDHDVSLSHHLARLTPRDLPHQRCEQHRITTDPADAARSAHTDHFGNTATFLTIEGPHRRLELTSLSRVDVSSPATAPPEETVPWERVAQLCTSDPPG